MNASTATNVTYYAVWEHQNGAHGGYVCGPYRGDLGHEPIQSRYTVGYCGFSTMREAVASVKKHRDTPCDGYCAPYLRRKGVSHGIDF